MLFWYFSRFFFSGLGWTRDLWSNLILLILRIDIIMYFFCCWKTYFLKISEFLKKVFFLNFWFFFLNIFFMFFRTLWVFFYLKNSLRFSLGFFCDLVLKLIRLLQKQAEVTTEHQKWPKISTNNMKALLLPEGQKKLWLKAKVLHRS